MEDQDKTKEQLVNELVELRQRIADLEKLEVKRKRTEEALRKSEERYRTILDNIEDGYFEVDTAGNFTFFNGFLCRMLGYSIDEMMGMNNRQYMDQENAQKVYQTFNHVYATGEPYRAFDWGIVRKDDTKRFVESSVSLLRDSKGERIGFRGIVRDITDRKFAEEALRRSEEEAKRLAQENAKTMETITGYSIEELKKISLNDTYENIEDRKVLIEAINRYGFVVGFQTQLKHKDGTLYDALLDIARINFDGEDFFQTICQDITERKRAEEALRVALTKYETLFDSFPIGITVSDKAGKIIEANRQSEQLLGITREVHAQRRIDSKE